MDSAQRIVNETVPKEGITEKFVLSNSELIVRSSQTSLYRPGVELDSSWTLVQSLGV